MEKGAFDSVWEPLFGTTKNDIFPLLYSTTVSFVLYFFYPTHKKGGFSVKRRVLPLFLALALLLPLFPAALAAGENAGSKVVYAAAPGEAVELDGEDFQLLCRQLTGQELDSVSFSLPASREGDLWYRRGKKGGGQVGPATAYRTDAEPYLSSVSFLPRTGFAGQAEVTFTMKSVKGKSASGTLLFHVPGPAADLTLSAGQVSPMDVAALNELCKEKTRSPLRLLTFEYPSWGTLVYDRGDGEPAPVTDRMVFYADAGEGRALSKVSLDTGRDQVRDPYLYLHINAEAADGAKFSANVRVEFPENRDSRGGLHHYAQVGTPIALANMSLTGVSSLTLSLPLSSQGTFWYEYGDPEARKLLPGETLYRDQEPFYELVTFVPADRQARDILIDAVIDGGERVVTFTYARPKDPETLRYSTQTDPVFLRGSDFWRAARDRNTGDIQSLRFETLPHEDDGTLADGNQKVERDREYVYYALDQFVFTPGPKFRGTAFTYIGTDVNGVEFTGKIEIAAGPYRSTCWSDLEGWAWAAPAVDQLTCGARAFGSGGVDQSFRPGDQATRMEVIYALTRLAYGNEATTTEGVPFPDLPKDPGMAQAAALAYRHGLVLGDEEGRLNPEEPVTRQDVLVLCYRLLQEKGAELPKGVSLSGFTDGKQVSSYAVEAAQVLVAARILQGGSDKKLNPLSPITRAELAVLLRRAFDPKG